MILPGSRFRETIVNDEAESQLWAVDCNESKTFNIAKNQTNRCGSIPQRAGTSNEVIRSWHPGLDKSKSLGGM